MTHRFSDGRAAICGEPVSNEPSATSPPITSGSEFLLLLCRTFVGYGAMFACLLLLLRKPSWTFSSVDAVFWVAFVVVSLLDRRAMRREGNGANWARSAFVRLLIAAAFWLAAQSVQLIK